MPRKIKSWDEAPEQSLPTADSLLLQPPPPTERPLHDRPHILAEPGALGAMKQRFGDINERVSHANEIEQALLQGQTIIELDPNLVDDAFTPDRMPSEDADLAFQAVIRQQGQTTPILVRPQTDNLGRYQVAFGHRRLHATRALGIKVRAVVRDLTDEELVIAQGQENSARKDLTYIERARFAGALQKRGFTREIITAALTVHQSDVYKLLTVAEQIPAAIIDAIGPAPTIGRPRWQDLAKLITEGHNLDRASTIVAAPSFAGLSSDKRFETLVDALRSKSTKPRLQPWDAADGARAAKFRRSAKSLTLIFSERTAPAFGEFVTERLQSLYDDYKSSRRSA